MAFLPYDPNRKLSMTGPAADWHAQWGGGGGIQAPSPYFDPGSPLYGQTPPPLTGTVGASGPGGGDVPFTAGAQPPPMPDWSQIQGGNWGQGGWQDPRTSAPAPQQGGGGFTLLSQLGRGLGRLGGALHLPGFGGGNQQAAPPQQTAPGPWMPQQGAPGGGMVLLRAPNGQTRQVPGDQVAHYLARGATRG